MDLNNISSKIIEAAIKVHREIGPGLLESVYQSCIFIELQNMGLETKAEVPVEVHYCGQKINDQGFRVDLLVEEQIVIELKSVESIKAIHKKQLHTYLKLAGKKLGLLINFNEILLKDGITRIINN